MKNNSFGKGKIRGKIAKKLQKEQVIRPNVFQTNGRSGLLEERLAYLQELEGMKAFLKRLASCSDTANSKDPPEFSPSVESCVKRENEKGKGVNSRTNKKANDE